MLLFYYFNFEKNYDFLKSGSPCILLNKNINFNKEETNWNWKIPHTILERRTLCFSSYKNRKLKVKPRGVGAQERKKRTFFVPFILLVGNFFFNICISSQCIVYRIHFQNLLLLYIKKLYFIHFFACFKNRWEPSVYS